MLCLRVFQNLNIEVCLNSCDWSFFLINSHLTLSCLHLCYLSFPSHYISSHHIIFYCTTSHHITSHHTTPHHILLYSDPIMSSHVRIPILKTREQSYVTSLPHHDLPFSPIFNNFALPLSFPIHLLFCYNLLFTVLNVFPCFSGGHNNTSKRLHRRHFNRPLPPRYNSGNRCR